MPTFGTPKQQNRTVAFGNSSRASNGGKVAAMACGLLKQLMRVHAKNFYAGRGWLEEDTFPLKGVYWNSWSFFRSASKDATSRPRKVKWTAAFTLMEAVVSVAILGFFVAASMTSIVADQVCSMTAKEKAIGMDFLTKYVENIKALPFASVAPGLPINSLYNGLVGAPLITIPAAGSWASITNLAFQTFYPDLLWLNNRNPMMLVTLTQNSVAGVLHDIEINVKVDWDAPLAKGGRLEVQVDSLRTMSVPTL